MSDQNPSGDYQHKFLVVVDGTDECDRAVTFAANRVKRTGGTVVLLSVISNDDFQHWLGVENVMRAEALQQATNLLEAQTQRIEDLGNITVEKIIREGRKGEEIERLIDSDRGIAILVLASGLSAEGPGPLVSAFASRGANALRVPVTIVPGSVSDKEIAAIC